MEFSLSIIYYLSALLCCLTLTPLLFSTIFRVQNPTPDDGVALNLLLYDNDTPLLNIDPEQTLDPTPNDPLTSTVSSPTVPSPTNSQSSHASLPNMVVPYKNNQGRSTLHYDDRDGTATIDPPTIDPPTIAPPPTIDPLCNYTGVNCREI